MKGSGFKSKARVARLRQIQVTGSRDAGTTRVVEEYRLAEHTVQEGNQLRAETERLYTREIQRLRNENNGLRRLLAQLLQNGAYSRNF